MDPFQITLVLILAIIGGLILMQVVAAITGRDPDLGYKDFRLGTKHNPRQDAGVETVKFRAALERYNDLSQGISAIVEAENNEEAVRRHGEWAHHAAAGIGQALTVGSRETYRVAVWLDMEEDGELLAMGTYITTTERLDRATTVGGLACQRRQECYVRDIDNDPSYLWPDGVKRRKAYKSIFAVPWGPADHPDGVITVDAKAVNGFADADLEIIRAFAGLIAAGWAAYTAERIEHATDGDN